MHARTRVRLELPGIAWPGTFVLDQTPAPLVVNDPIAYAALTFYQPPPDQELRTGPAASGRLVVTRLDTIARVVAGTFEFTAGHALGGTTVRVSEGRFDCAFWPRAGARAPAQPSIVSGRRHALRVAARLTFAPHF